MNLSLHDDRIPGTVLNRIEMGDVTGQEFLDKIFYIADGIMLSQVRDVSGVDGSTLQNWVKRGWVANTVHKRYNKDQLARILIINMMRDSMLLERIDFLLRYINGDVENREDDIIPESRLYDYICVVLDAISGESICTMDKLHDCIAECTADYVEKLPGARERLQKALEIIVFAYYASLVQACSNRLYEQL